MKKATALAAGANSIKDLTDAAISIANAVNDGTGGFQVPNIGRDNFAASVAQHYNTVGYNVAVIHPSSSASGHAAEFSVHPKWGFHTISYKVYLGVPGRRMVVTNHGDGGFINWAYHGRVESRNGGTVVMV